MLVRATASGRSVKVSLAVKNQRSEKWIRSIQPVCESMKDGLGPASVAVGRELKHGPKSQPAIVGGAVEIAGAIRRELAHGFGAIAAASEFVEDGFRLGMRWTNCNRQQRGK